MAACFSLPAASDLHAIESLAGQAGIAVTETGSVRGIIEQVAQDGGVDLDYQGSDRNAIERLAELLCTPAGCAWPLTATEDEIAAAFGGGRAAQDGPSWQRFRLPVVGGLAQPLEVYAAQPGVGVEAVLTDITTGMRGVECWASLPAVAGEGTDIAAVAQFNFVQADTELSVLAVNCLRRHDGTALVTVTRPMAGVVGSQELAADTVAVGVRFDGAARRLAVWIDGEPVELADDGYTGDEFQMFVALGERAGAVPAGADPVLAEFRTAREAMQHAAAYEPFQTLCDGLEPMRVSELLSGYRQTGAVTAIELAPSVKDAGSHSEVLSGYSQTGEVAAIEMWPTFYDAGTHQETLSGYSQSGEIAITLQREIE